MAPAEIVDSAVEAAGPWLAGARLERTIAPDLPSVLGDPAALCSALRNLITNAVKYGGPTGWVGIRADLVSAPGRLGEIQITVEDHGAGIARDDLPHIFEPFYRGTNAIGQQVSGSGVGLSLVRLRQRGVQTPILILTARGQIVDRVLGLKLGADDYLIKPFEMAELLARVEALLRRRGSQSTLENFAFGDIAVDVRRARVTKAGALLDLTAREFTLLCYLLEHRGEALSREELLNKVWGYDAMPLTRTVDVHVAWLRHKLEDNPKCPRYILTVHGLGYKFSVDD